MSPQQARDRDLIRELARQVAEIAASERNREIIQRWRDVNALRQPDRAPVWCRLVGCWDELLPDDQLICQDPSLRAIEAGFRKTLIKRDIGDDSPVDDYFAVAAVFDGDQPNPWGVPITKRQPAESDGAWAYDPPLKTPADYDRLRIAHYTYNEAATQRKLAWADELLGDILPVRLTCQPIGSATLGNPAADLRGLTQMMLDMAAEPELMHQLMAFLRDSVLAAMADVAATGLLTPNNTGPMWCSDPIGEVGRDGTITYKNLWIHANSQEFDAVSPAMWQEFCLDYQLPILDQFGYTHYGCCENLTHKIDGVLSIPNLRIFTCSAWTDLDVVIEKCQTDYVIMWRQKASDVVFPDDIRTIRRDLQAGAKQLQGCSYQIVLRELQTLGGHLDRLHVWTAEAKEAAARYA